MLLDSAETEDFVDGFFNHGLFIDGNSNVFYLKSLGLGTIC